MISPMYRVAVRGIIDSWCDWPLDLQSANRTADLRPERGQSDVGGVILSSFADLGKGTGFWGINRLGWFALLASKMHSKDCYGMASPSVSPLVLSPPQHSPRP